MKASILRKNGHEVVNLNRRRAIRERCLNCSGWNLKEVYDCEISNCSLYPYRSGNGKQNPKDRKKAIREYCLDCMSGQRNEIKLCPSQDCPLFAYRMGIIDRTAEIKSTTKTGDIEAVSQSKIRKPYLSMDNDKKEKNYTNLTGVGFGSDGKMVMSPWQNHRSNHSRGMNGLYGKR